MHGKTSHCMHLTPLDQMKYFLAIFFSFISPLLAKETKIIEIGWDSRSTVYVQQHIGEMEKIPFDGLVLNLTFNGLHALSKRPVRQNAFAGRAFGAKALVPAEY